MSELDSATREATDVSKRLGLLARQAQEIKRQGDWAWVAIRRLDIPTDDDGGGVICPPEHVIRADFVLVSPKRTAAG